MPIDLNYLGIGPTSDSGNANNGFLILNTTNTQTIFDSLPVNQTKTLSLIQAGWSDGTTSFAGINGYLASSSASSSQKTLQNVLDYKNNVLNPCLTYSAVMNEGNKYIANSSIGVANGVAQLDSSGKIPLSQLPSLGSGYVVGPLGTTSVFGGSATNALDRRLKIAEWAIQNSGGINFQPMVYMVVNAQTDNILGRPVIEVRISNGPMTSYSASNALVSIGTGRNYYTGSQTINVLPCANTSGQSSGGTVYPATYNTYLSAWLYDAGIGTSSIGSASSSIITASAFLIKAVL